MNKPITENQARKNESEHIRMRLIQLIQKYEMHRTNSVDDICEDKLAQVTMQDLLTLINSASFSYTTREQAAAAKMWGKYLYAIGIDNGCFRLGPVENIADLFLEPGRIPERIYLLSRKGHIPVYTWNGEFWSRINSDYE